MVGATNGQDQPVNLTGEAAMREQLAGLARLETGAALAGSPASAAASSLASRAALEAAALQQFANLHNLSAVASALQQQHQQLLLNSGAHQRQQHLNNLSHLNSRLDSSHQNRLEHQLNNHQISHHADHHLRLLKTPPVAALEVALRRGRGRELRKCRKVYGMERRSLWCTQCKWKKACSRFCDRQLGASSGPQPSAFSSR